MKRVLGWLLLMCLMAVSAGAETSMTAYETESRNLELNKLTNTLVTRMENGYQIIDAQGNALGEVYGAIRAKKNFFSVANEDVVNCWGLVDGQGNPVMPMQYGDVDVISDRWTVGITLAEATEEHYDYTTLFSSTKAYYLVDTIDVYYRGNKVGSLTRNEWSSADAYGDYLHVRTLDGSHLFFNKEMVQAEREASYGQEYDDDYKSKTIWHQGSGQAAFTEGCTLTADEVSQKVYLTGNNQLTALDGTIIADLSMYNAVYVNGNYQYYRVRGGAEGKYGLLDEQGNVVAPCEYDEFDYSLDRVKEIGYVYAVRDGKGGFINLSTREENGFLYSSDATRNYACYLKATDLDGSIVIVSAAAGRLDHSFKEVDMDYASASAGNRFFVGQNEDGSCGVYGLYGEEIIPATAEFDSIYNFTISADGTVILASKGNRQYTIYTVAYDPAPAAE